MITSQKIGARLGFALLGAGMLLSAAPALAQTGNPGLDSPGEALSRNLRSLAENPKSLAALTGAGKAALELGDPQAAITFFGRAEEQAPRDGRIKMWLGAALIQLQQPQGALKFLGEASSMGVPEAEVAGVRGLAYDFLGDPRRAQRDYRLALQSKPDAEVSRRLALSLAISGEREAALQALEGQLLVRDHAAERTRVFVLALTGDAAGAARALQASMPGQGAAMTPFLERLPALTLSERALAVHLGQFPSRARYLPVPAPAPAPNTYARLDPSTAGRAGKPDTRQAALGSRSSQPTKTPSPPRQAAIAQPKPKAPSPAASQPQHVASVAPGRRALPSGSAASGNPLWSSSRGELPTRRVERPATKPAPQEQAAATKAPSPQPAAPAPGQVAAAMPVRAEPSTQQIVTALGAQPQPQAQAQPTAAAASLGQQLAAAIAPPPAQSPVQTASVEPSSAFPNPGFSIAPAQVSPPQKPTSELSSVEEAPAPGSGAGDGGAASRLAGIASLIATLPDATPAEPGGPAPEMVRVDAAEKPAAKPVAKPAPVPATKPAAAPPAAAPKAKPTVVAKKETPAPAKKELPAAAKKPAAPAEPARIWVQIAGGADKAALPREFTRLKAKAPKLFAARSAWTTPLKATNRLLVGPFKTDKEAQEFVNELKKTDVTGFAWTSDAGQKIEKLSAK